MESKGYRRDQEQTQQQVGQQQELIKAAKIHYCRQLHPSDDTAYHACLAE
jgi:hypothetical protein